MKENNTKKSNLTKAIIFFAVMFLLGAGIGLAIAAFVKGSGLELPALFDGIDSRKAGIVFTAIHAVFAVIMLLSWKVTFVAAVKELASLSPDDEDGLDRVKEKLNPPAFISMILSIGNMTLFSCSCYFLLKEPKLYDLIAVAIFLGALILSLAMNSRLIEMEKRINPEKHGSVWDRDFQKKWLGSCDEAQKQIIYQAGYSAFKAANSLCSTLWVVIFIGQFLFRFGLMPVIVLGTVWMTLNLTYARTAAALERGRKV